MSPTEEEARAEFIAAAQDRPRYMEHGWLDNFQKRERRYSIALSAFIEAVLVRASAPSVVEPAKEPWQSDDLHGFGNAAEPAKEQR